MIASLKDVLARAERVSGEVGTGASVVAGRGPTDGDAIRPPRRRIGDEKIGEDELIADVLERELLLAAELPPELRLPLFQRHPGRNRGA